jgi:transposase
VGFAAGGEAGARLLQALGLTASPDTVLRHLRRTVLPHLPTPRVLGVDDWSYRRGQTYGTILVDLEQHRPVDVLPDRSAPTFATWLEQHPGVEVVSRDRGGSYADGAQQGAPHAVQVADRWHVLKNLMEALERVLSQEQRTLREAAQAVAAMLPPAGAPPTSTGNPPTGTTDPPALPPAPRLTRQDQRRTERRAQRHARYEAVISLQRQGLPLTQIARELDLDRGTVRRFVCAAGFSEQASRRGRPSLLAPFTAYLQERWNAGEQNGQHLLAELRTQGYSGSSTILYTLLAQWRGHPYARHSGPARRTVRVGQCSPRQIAWLLVKAEEERSDEEQAYVRELLQRSAAVAHAQQLVTAFFTLVRTRHAVALESWLQAAEASGSRDLVGFAQGIRRDREAVDAGLTLDWSQGQTEGAPFRCA